MIHLELDIASQQMRVFDDSNCIREYIVSTGKNGAGELNGSEKTPRGLHVIRAKIGDGCVADTVFVGRRATGELYHPELRAKFPERDWILTRILWLCGKEPGKNRFGNVDTMRRYVYIHGTPDDVAMGKPGSRGCIRMRNQDIIDLFSITPVGAQIMLK